MYYYHDGGNEVGPYDFATLEKLVDSGIVNEKTLVRHTDGDHWSPLSDHRKNASDSYPYPDATGDPHRHQTTTSNLSSMPVVQRAEDKSQLMGQSDLNPSVPNVDDAGWHSTPAPWRRYAARMLDTTLNGIIFFSLFGIAIYAVAPATADNFFFYLETDVGNLLDVMLTAFVASIVGGSLIGITGFTLGKWIFGIKVTRMDGSRLGLGPGVFRDLNVFLRGLGLGIPIVSLLTLIFSFRRLKDNKTTSWDRDRYVVWHRPSGFVQVILNVVGILLFFVVISVIGLIAEI